MSITLITGPVVEPVTLSDAKLQLGLSPMEDTDQVKERQLSRLLRRHIKTARMECEKRTGSVFITQTWLQQWDSWPRREEIYAYRGYPEIVLAKPPFQSLQYFTYVDTAGNLQNMIAPNLPDGQRQPGSNNPLNFTAAVWGCQIDPQAEEQPCRIAPPWAQPFPPIRMIPNNIAAQSVCGYGDTGDTVPASITQAILFLVHSYYDPSVFKDIDGLVENLLSGYVNRIS
jgi:uncharacterized phiE125 gp8 family phage protein